LLRTQSAQQFSLTMTEPELIPHLFRTEFRKITAVLCKHFGIAHIDVAEDLASETFLSALESWPYKGLPKNPTGWLYAVAKHKAINYFKRQEIFTAIASSQKNDLDGDSKAYLDLSEQNITDSQLQMLFALCHPAISTEAQIGLSLRILCGFGIDEIANAFLTNKETINKRLFRARERLSVEKCPIEFPGLSEIDKRLETVLTTLYLLFSEGYYSESQDAVLRQDLCWEAMRLTSLLIENPQTNKPSVNALLSLMCFHASRFEARKNASGEMILYQDQDETLWDKELISKGAYFMHQATQGSTLSKYHLEASIAYWHTQKTDTKEKWETILQLYNHLLQLEYSPIAALNRTFALAKANGHTEAIKEAEKLSLTDNYFYFTLLGELYKSIDKEKARLNFQKALALAKTQTDKQTIKKSIDQL
jgi:RNA polymerase sigma factor (sigma-70 family)